MIRSALPVLILSLAAAPALAQSQTRLDNLSAVDVFELADRARAVGQLDDAITLYDALARDPDLRIRAEARFRKGTMLAEARRYRDAAIAYRSVLDEQPEAQRVRLELARVLALMGDEGGARRQLRQAQTGGLPPDVAATVGQFDRALRSRKKFGGTFEVAVAPDSNVNRATQARVLDTIIAPLTLSEDARAQSGLGAHLAGQAYARFGVAQGVSLVPRLSGLGNLFRDGAFDDVSGSALLGVEWQRTGSRISASAGRTWRWYGGQTYARTDAVSLDWLHTLGRRAQIIAAASASKVTYARNDLQNGRIYDLNLTVERALSARAGISVSVSATRQTAREPGYATASGGLTMVGWREAGRTTLFASAGVRRTEGDTALFLYGERRREWLVTARAGATFRGVQVHGFAPFLRMSYERNQSSLQLYDYRRVAGEFGITRAF